GEGQPLRVVHDQTLTPSYTLDVARATIALLATGRHGLFHLTNSGSCTWYEFARTIFELAGVPADLTPITSQEFGAKARRPGYSVLSCQKLAAAGVSAPRDWRSALAAYLEERKKRQG